MQSFIQERFISRKTNLEKNKTSSSPATQNSVRFERESKDTIPMILPGQYNHPVYNMNHYNSPSMNSFAQWNPYSYEPYESLNYIQPMQQQSFNPYSPPYMDFRINYMYQQNHGPYPEEYSNYYYEQPQTRVAYLDKTEPETPKKRISFSKTIKTKRITPTTKTSNPPSHSHGYNTKKQFGEKTLTRSKHARDFVSNNPKGYFRTLYENLEEGNYMERI
jgi:hypothetical protein